MEDLFKGAMRRGTVLRRESYVCEHSKGLHPRVAREGKLLPPCVYAKLETIVKKEYSMFMRDECLVLMSSPGLTLFDYKFIDGTNIPLKYARIMGSLPRDAASTSTALSVKITSSAMGRVVVRPSQLSDKNNKSSMPSGSKHGDGVMKDEIPAEWSEYDDDEEIDMSFTRVYHVLALGFQDGKVRLVDALTGGSVLFGSTPGDGDACNVKTVGKKMADLFLETMRSWGTTSTLQKRVQLHRYCGQNHRWGLQWHSSSGASLVDPFIQQVEKDLH